MATDLFFSEYVEGSGDDKALEIFNGTGAPVDLFANAYNVQIYENGSTIPSYVYYPQFTIQPGEVLVIANPSAAAGILARADTVRAGLRFDGNDTILLVRGSEVIDRIGRIGEDPGSEWGTGLTSTADNTLRRKPHVTAGDRNFTDPFDPSLEWDGYPRGTFDGLGTHEWDYDVAPLCSAATVSQTSLWPANGSLVPLTVQVPDTDGDAVPVVFESVFQDEPVGKTIDAVIGPDGSLKLRAERDGSGNGRAYHVTFTARGPVLSCSGTVTVSVPHDQGRNSKAVDGGPLYDSTRN